MSIWHYTEYGRDFFSLLLTNYFHLSIYYKQYATDDDSLHVEIMLCSICGK